MKESAGNPPHFLFCPSTRRIPADLDHLNLHDLRKKARYWVNAASKLPKDALMAALRIAMEDPTVAAPCTALAHSSRARCGGRLWPLRRFGQW